MQRVDRWAEKQPLHRALSDGVRARTYAELRDAAYRFARFLKSRKIVSGDRIAVQLPNWSAFLVCYLAAACIGVILVPIMPVYRENEGGHILRTSGARLVVTTGEFRKFAYADMFRGLRESTRLRDLVLVRRPANAGEFAFDDLPDVGSAELAPHPDADAGHVFAYHGRVKDIIIRGGQNLSAREIEEHLISHPQIRRCGGSRISRRSIGREGLRVRHHARERRADIAGGGGISWKTVNGSVEYIGGQIFGLPVLAGEAVYRSPVCTAGDYNDEAATREAFEYGWFHSGDSCVYAEDGLRITITAAVMLRPTDSAPSEAAIIAFARERLAGFETPRRVVFVESFPETVGGKIQKHILRVSLRE